MYFPNFTISNKILKNIGLIEACREVITNAPLVPAWEKKFQEEAIVRQVHHGTHLEGNPLNISEAARVVAGKEIIGRARDIQEVINYRNVIRFIEKFQKTENRKQKTENSDTLSSEPRPLSSVLRPPNVDEALIKKLHKLTTEKILPPEKAGHFRNKQVVIRNSQTGEVSFRPPPAVEVPFLMEEFLEWLNGPPPAEVHPVLKSGIAQYEIVRIHPFLDGNGRVARALATLVLYKEGYDIRRFFSLEEHYDKEAEGYYKALQSVQKITRSSLYGVATRFVNRQSLDVKKDEQRQTLNDTGLENEKRITNYDLTPWLEYFTQGLAIELTRIKEKIQKLSVDMHLKERLGGQQIFLNERQIKIVEHLQKLGYLQNKMFSQLFPMISEDTILRELQDLMKKKIIVKKGKTKGARYVLRS